MRRSLRRTAVALALGSVLGLAACSAGDGSGSGPVGPSIDRRGRDLGVGVAGDPTGGDRASGSAPGELVGLLPDPEPGLIRVDDAAGSSSPRAVAAYEAASPYRVEQSTTGAAPAFEGLCTGQVDLVHSDRPISPAEWDDCRARGLDVVQVQVASDAVVLATRRGSDLGAGCLDLTRVAALLSSGDDDLQLAGPGPGSPTLAFLARSALGAPGAGASRIGPGYRVVDDPAALRDAVVGSPSDRLAAGLLPAVEARRTTVRGELRVALAALTRARADVADALAAQDDGTGVTDGSLTSRAYAARRAALAEVERLRAVLGPLETRYRAALGAAARLQAVGGTVGVFDVAAATSSAAELQPLQVSADGATGCVAPSPSTIASGAYPLARPLLLTATTRSLRRPEVVDHVEFLLRNAPTFATADGLVPVAGAELATELGWVLGPDYPTFASVDGGPVELQVGPDVGRDPVAPAAPETPAQ